MLKSNGFYGRILYIGIAVLCMATGALAGPNALGIGLGCGGALMLILRFIFRKEASRG